MSKMEIQFRIKTQSLSKAIDTIAGIAAEQDKSVQGNSLIKFIGDAETKVITLCGSSMSNSIAYDVLGCEFEKDFTCCIDYMKLINLVRSLAGEWVTLRVKDGWAFIASGEARARVPSLDPDKFPAIELTYVPGVKIPSDIFTRMLQSASSTCAKQDHGQFSLKGVHVLCDGETLTMEGCNGIDVCQVTTKVTTAIKFDFIIPGVTVNPLLKVAAVDSTVDLHLDNNLAQLSCGDVICKIRTVAGKYPEVSRVIPVDQNFAANVNRKSLLEVLKRAASFVESEGTQFGKVINFKWERNRVTVSSSSSTGIFEEGTAAACEGLENPCLMYLKYDQLVLCISQLKSDSLSFGFNNGREQVKLTPVNSVGDTEKNKNVNSVNFDFKYVTMPSHPKTEMANS